MNKLRLSVIAVGMFLTVFKSKTEGPSYFKEYKTKDDDYIFNPFAAKKVYKYKKLYPTGV